MLNIVFRIANDRQMLLIDMKDLRSMLNYGARQGVHDDLRQRLVAVRGRHPARAHRRRVRRGEIRCDSGAGIAHGEVR